MKFPVAPPRLVDSERQVADLLRDATREYGRGLDADRAWLKHESRAARPALRLFIAPAVAFALCAAALLLSSHFRPQAMDASTQAEPEPVISSRRPELSATARLLSPSVVKPAVEGRRIRPQPVLAPNAQPAPSDPQPASSAGAVTGAVEGDRGAQTARDCLSYARAGDAQQAEQCFEQQALGENLTAEVALYELARLRRDMLGKPAVALLALDEYGRRFPHGHLSPEVQFSRLELLQRLGRSAEVLRASADLLASSSGTERAAEIHFLRGNVYSSSDAAAAAREYGLASGAPGRIGDDAAFLVGLNLEKSNRPEQARAAFERYLARSAGRHVNEAKAHLAALSSTQGTEPQ
jgi:tetratricopeptide (TPR) repeat protein